ALLPALGSAVYKGVLVSTTSQPGWKDARWLGSYHTSSAVMLGCVLMLVVASLMGQEGATGLLRPALGVLLILNLIPLSLLALDVRATLSRAYTLRALGDIGALAIASGRVATLRVIFYGHSCDFDQVPGLSGLCSWRRP